MGEPKFFTHPRPDRQSDPYVGGFAITPGTSEFTIHTRGIYVGGTGDIIVVPVWGAEFILRAVQVGTTIHLRAKKILAVDLNSPANTTSATFLVGLY